jgi:xanthine dehydrogenase accessory factor
MNQDPANQASIYQSVAKLELEGDSGALCTIIRSSGSTPRHTGSKMLVYPDGSFIGTVGGGQVESRIILEALAALSDGRPRLLSYEMVDPSRGDPGVCGGQLEVYVEPILSRPTLLIIGGGHVGRAVAHLARWLNYKVVVSDDRVEFCTPEANPDADSFLPVLMSEIPQHLKINSQTYIVITSRGSNVDIEGLPALLNGTAGYIGVIGSRRRWAVTRKALLTAGLDEMTINRVHSPMGLELQAETPEEIAVSIMAEVMMVRSGGTGKKMMGKPDRGSVE